MSLITWSSQHREENSSSLWWSFSVRSTIWFKDVRKCWPETLEINEDFTFTYTGWVCPFPMHLSLPIHMLGNILHFWYLIKKNKKNKKRSTSYHWSLFAKFHSLPLTSQVLISATKMMLSKQTDICLLVHPQKEIGQHLLNKLSEEYFSQLPLLVLKNTVYSEG